MGRRNSAVLEIYYIGVDIVRPLVDSLNSSFASEGICFVCLDIIEDELPDADLYLVRQVFQHLNNHQIGKIVEKLASKTALVTEHIPTAPVAYNMDKSTGPDIRLYRRSGVFLECPPFSVECETLLEVPQRFNEVDALLRTSLIRSV